MIILSEALRMIKGLGYYENDEYTLFRLPPSSIQPYIRFGSSMSFSELLKI